VAVEAEAVGSRAEYYENQIPAIVEAILTEPNVDKLNAPDPYKSGRMPVIVESTRIVKKEIGEEVFIASTIMGPLNCAGQIRGIENLLMDFYDRPEFVNDLMDFAVEVGTAYGKALIEAGADCILLGEALASPAMISPKFYKDFVRDKEKKLITALHNAGSKNTILHICGDIRRILNDCILTTTNLIDVDWMVDIGEVVGNEEATKRNVVARGNINPAGVLLSENPEDVIKETKEIIEKNRNAGRFILSAGCNMSFGSVPNNLRAMVNAAEMYGYY
jgi:MtaA/CmuA family methyltransferase